MGCTATGVTTTPGAATSTSIPTSPFFDGDVAEVKVGEVTLVTAVADTSEERAQGLMGVADLGELDGMLFIHDAPGPVSYTMRETLIPLDIWFIAEDGEIVGTTEMEPCEAEPCPTYPSPGPVLMTLETPLGEFEFEPEAVVSVLGG